MYGRILKTPQKHNHNKPLLYIQQLKEKPQIAPATLQLSSLKPNNEDGKEVKKWEKENRPWHTYSLQFYEIVNQAWTWWRWWNVVKEPA